MAEEIQNMPRLSRSGRTIKPRDYFDNHDFDAEARARDAAGAAEEDEVASLGAAEEDEVASLAEEFDDLFILGEVVGAEEQRNDADLGIDDVDGALILNSAEGEEEKYYDAALGVFDDNGGALIFDTTEGDGETATINDGNDVGSEDNEHDDGDALPGFNKYHSPPGRPSLGSISAILDDEEDERLMNCLRGLTFRQP